MAPGPPQRQWRAPLRTVARPPCSGQKAESQHRQTVSTACHRAALWFFRIAFVISRGPGLRLWPGALDCRARLGLVGRRVRGVGLSVTGRRLALGLGRLNIGRMGHHHEGGHERSRATGPGWRRVWRRRGVRSASRSTVFGPGIFGFHGAAPRGSCVSTEE